MQGEALVGGAEAGNEVVLEGSYGSFRGIDSVVNVSFSMKSVRAWEHSLSRMWRWGLRPRRTSMCRCLQRRPQCGGPCGLG